MALPPLYSIKVFESVARLGNMSAAAVELHVTIGAVSQQVKALQDGLGVALFEKRGRQLVLTDIGHTLRQRVAGALDEINEAVQVVQNSAKQASEQIELTLSIPPIEGVAWLARPLFSFMEESRSIKLNVIKATKFSQVDWRKADVAVVYGTPPWPGFWWRLLHGIHMTPVCSPQFLRGHQAIRGVEHLSRHRLLHEDNGAQWQHWLAEAGYSGAGTSDVYFEDFGMVLQAARDGFGVALSDGLVSARDLDEGRLVQPLSFSVPAVHNYYCVCSEDKRKSPEALAFIDWLMSTTNW
ncbi:LysR substrate-binding domain-containing protein [Pseudomonas aeruginosa]|uniref:LysR substrate-binding domain-containing protein n=1 Tax=Pseudomonas aeruginosa TaxID=287 RepID=UPI000872E5CE|nr:LysR substrate-binding domain-containing protein [Pseudomonas aeruginosa]MBG5591824.1 LysR family transcriptional regulator [Pseudomonas aeruginosa]MCO2228286.1 LysR family transcriptional regulator [Pseudomonas aeruginosa]MCO2233534.1 LysR family transcriptional regulator [Pseudomonas aeruginosa]MCO2240618.1 LysR family transcriptional regulator [Pseudomonas aeruginosa]MCO2335398.1 LysR family transcriptional regulator [Pseudomonas aeruginosa]